MRLVFWGGAVAVGLISVAFAWAANRASDLFHHILIHPWLAFILTPGVFVLSTWLARRFFPGSQGSGIPRPSLRAAPAIAAMCCSLSA